MLASFTPSQVGQHQVSVTFRGKHLRGSPFTLEVVDRPIYRRDYSQVSDQPVSRFGSLGADDGQYNGPYSVACNSRGEIVVADAENHRIQVFDRNGKFLFMFGSSGHGNGQFYSAFGLAVDQRNNQIVVAELSDHLIQIFDEKGLFFECLGLREKARGFSPTHGVLLLTGREIMSWLMETTIVFRFSIPKVN